MSSSCLSWPWLEGIAVALTDPPIPPVNDKDDRPAVKDLIQKHRTNIDAVAKALLSDEPLFDPKNKHDDLWILRFLLSNKNKVKPALKAAKSTLAFRQEYKLDETDIRATPPNTAEVNNGAHNRYMKYIDDECFCCHVPDPKLSPVFFLVFSGFHQNDLVKHVDVNDWKPAIMYVSEWCFQWTDYITRTTGLLTKNIRLVDTDGMKLSEVNMECNRRDSKAMGSMDQMYPQMLEGIKIINSTPWIRIPWKVLRTIMPKRIVSKIDFIEPLQNESEKEKLLKYISEEHLPSRFGGSYTTWPPQYDETK